ICPAQLRLPPARYMDLSSTTTPPACSSWAPTSAVAAARIQARKRRQSPKLYTSDNEPMAQKLVANTTAPNRQPIRSPPSANEVAPCCAMLSRNASIIAGLSPQLSSCIDPRQYVVPLEVISGDRRPPSRRVVTASRPSTVRHDRNDSHPFRQACAN